MATKMRMLPATIRRRLRRLCSWKPTTSERRLRRPRWRLRQRQSSRQSWLQPPWQPPARRCDKVRQKKEILFFFFFFFFWLTSGRAGLSRVWQVVGRKQVDMWRVPGAVRGLGYFVFASIAITGIALGVDRDRECSVPVLEWLVAHSFALLLRVGSALYILFVSRRAQLFERRRSALCVVSKLADAACILLCIIGLSYLFSTAAGDCPSSSPYSYRALALLASFEAFVALMAVFVGSCMLAGGWAGARGLRVPGMGFHAVAQQMEAAAASRGATFEQIAALPLRRFVKSGTAPDKPVALESADPVIDLLPLPAKAKRGNDGNNSNSNSSSSGSSSSSSSDDDSEMEHTCAVCLGEYEPRELVRVLPCEHYFHRECIDTWVRRYAHASLNRRLTFFFFLLRTQLVRNKTCPFCKHSIDAPPPAHAQSVRAVTVAETASTDAEDE